MRAASANVGSGSIQCSDCEQVTMSTRPSSSPVSCANACLYSTPEAASAAASIAGFGSILPRACREPGTAAEVDDHGRLLGPGVAAQQLQQHLRWSRPKAVVAI